MARRVIFLAESILLTIQYKIYRVNDSDEGIFFTFDHVDDSKKREQMLWRQISQRGEVRNKRSIKKGAGIMSLQMDVQFLRMIFGFLHRSFIVPFFLFSLEQ